MNFSNLEWYGWVLLVLSVNCFLCDATRAARWVHSKDTDVEFSWGVLGLAIVLYMVTP